MLGCIEHASAMRHFQQGNAFLYRPACDREEVLAVGLREPAVAFGQVRGDGERRAVQLVREEIVAAREGFAEGRDFGGESDRLLVDLQFLKQEGHSVTRRIRDRGESWAMASQRR
jgi:hypothetical protein